MVPINRRRKKASYEEEQGLIVEYEHEDSTDVRLVNSSVPDHVYKDEIISKKNYYKQTARPDGMPDDGVMNEFGSEYDRLTRQLESLQRPSANTAISQLKRSTGVNRITGKPISKNRAAGLGVGGGGTSHEPGNIKERPVLHQSDSPYSDHKVHDRHHSHESHRYRNRGRKLPSFLLILAGIIMTAVVIAALHQAFNPEEKNGYVNLDEDSSEQVPLSPIEDDTYSKLISDVYK